jgi:uncharacterized protein (TIGR03089 family)
LAQRSSGVETVPDLRSLTIGEAPPGGWEESSLACALVETAGGAFQSFVVLAERQPGRYGDKPFLTWYDDARDQRVELSFKTFDNWVAKVANLLVDEFDTGPGDRVAVGLAGHWQTAVVLAACWLVGAGVVAVAPDGGGAVLAAALGGGVVAAFVGEERAAEAAAAPGMPPVVAVAADLFGRSEHDLGAARNFARVVPVMGDHFPATADPEGEALQLAPAGVAAAALGGEGATMSRLLGEAGRVAGRVGLGDGDRLLSGLGLLTPTGAAVGLLAPFGSGAGVVLAAAFEPGRFWKRVADERVTVAALSPAQAGSVLSAGPPPEDLDRSRLRAVTCPAEPVDEALRAGFADRLGVPLLPDG